MKKTFTILLGVLMATNVYAQTSFVPNLLPITTDRFDLGTTTPDKRWFHIFSKYASTTALTVSGLTSKDCVGTDSTGLLITGTCTGGSAGTPNLVQSLYSGTNYYTASTTDTTNLSWYFKNGFLSTASSTLTSSLTLSSLSNGGLGVNNGLVYSGATTTFSGGLTYASGNVTNTLTAGDGLTRTVDDLDCDTASGTVFGCLSSANWTTFNNKQDTITAGDGLTLTGTDIDLDIPVLVASGGTGLTSFTANSLLYSNSDGTALAFVATSTLTISGIALGSNLADLTATNASLTFSGTYNGSTARTIGLNLANPNTWTGLQQFSNATSTQFSAGTGNVFYVDGNGRIQGKDTTNAWSGVISPTRSFGLTSGTSTVWTASTTNSAYSPFLVMPFTGTLRQVRCATDASFLGVNVQVNGSNVTPSYFVASTTIGKVSFTAGNTFTVGQKVLVNFGTTTTASTLSISCTFDATETY